MSNLYNSPTTPAPNPKRPWFKKKRIMIPGGLFALIVLGSAVGGTEDASTTDDAKPQATKTVTATPTPSEKSADKALKDLEEANKELQEQVDKAEKSKAAEKPVERPEMGTLPNFVGMNHQDAQDTAQAKGFFNLREKDHTGMERILFLDSNWKVCKQEPAAGEHAVEKTITLYSVKLDESC
jgi:beta-lactam-binding protein with PASTA domain